MKRSDKDAEENRLMYLYTFGFGMAAMSLGVFLITLLYILDNLWRRYQIIPFSIDTISSIELYAAIFALTGTTAVTIINLVDTAIWLKGKIKIHRKVAAE